MANLKINEYNPFERPYAPRLSEDEWERFKPILVALNSQGLSRMEIVNVATEKHGFRGTYSALVGHFKTWGLTTRRAGGSALPAAVLTSGIAIPVVSSKYAHQTENVSEKNKAGASTDSGEIETFSAEKPMVKEGLSDVEQLQVHSSASPDPVGELIHIERIHMSSRQSSDDDSSDEEISNAHIFADKADTPTFEGLLESVPPETKSLQDVDEPQSVQTSVSDPMAFVSKRPRSQASSLTWSRSSRSSDTRSFFRYAKRLRQVFTMKSPMALTGTPSEASSHKSQDFGSVTGFGFALNTVEEYNTELSLHHTALIERENYLPDFLSTPQAESYAQRGFYNNTLQKASWWGNEKRVQMLLNKGADVDALVTASGCGYEKVVQMLLDKGVDVNAQGGFYGNALMAALACGHEKIVQMLLDKGADVNAQGGFLGNALQATSWWGNEKRVKMLLDKGVDVNAQGGLLGNALQVASVGGHEKIVQMLLDKGADANAQGGFHDNALQAASAGGHEKIVQMLLDKGADVNAQEGFYGNALQAASLSGNEKAVQMLLDKGVDVNAQGGEYGNALQAASSKGHVRVVQMLLDKGADINARGGYYGSALQAASKLGHQKVVQILQKHISLDHKPQEKALGSDHAPVLSVVNDLTLLHAD
ncbi:hypothetical protein H2198_001360 [Neophaeococcomyces mojaviensis]|uniref:Uncharacterized protein n=1 Tax=Neophaeococcomyces mojaviensis TaxID=3383035 RepID=A0ACC3AHQ0_9EURO|nr:hypothetical protein H2198_001360 [Knufia sp. JES_112]